MIMFHGLFFHSCYLVSNTYYKIYSTPGLDASNAYVKDYSEDHEMKRKFMFLQRKQRMIVLGVHAAVMQVEKKILK